MSTIPFNKETDDRFVVLEAVASLGDLASGRLIVGNGSGTAAPVDITGDVLISNAGVTSINSGVVVNADVNAAAAIAYSKMAACASNKIIAGVSNVPTVCAVAGDLTMSAAGTDATFAIASDVIVNSDINSAAAIALSKIHLLNETKTDGTTLSSIKLVPTPSVATGSINYHKLVCIGDETGTTAYGFGDVAKPTTGVMASFGRTIAATSAITDTGLDIRAINKLDNSATTYNLQGAYIKAKDYSGAKLANLTGLFIETVADGTISGSSIALKIGSDATTLTNAIDMSSAVVTNGADIKLSSGLTIGSGSAAPTHAAATGSLYIRTGQSDQKAMLYICTVNSGTWVLLNTVTA